MNGRERQFCPLTIDQALYLMDSNGIRDRGVMETVEINIRASGLFTYRVKSEKKRKITISYLE